MNRNESGSILGVCPIMFVRATFENRMRLQQTLGQTFRRELLDEVELRVKKQHRCGSASKAPRLAELLGRHQVYYNVMSRHEHSYEIGHVRDEFERVL